MECNFTRIGDHIELVLEKKFEHSPEKVWRVLTEQELIRQWFPCDVVGQWKVGEVLQFIFPAGQHEGLSEEECRGEVLVVERLKRLEFTWGKYKYCCELFADGEGCRLRFTESFADPSEGARSASGWEMCFENFDALLQNISITPFDFKVWQTKFEKYVKKFESELGHQQGAPETGS